MRRLLPFVALLALVAGCEDYADTVSCSRGTVLSDDDECVPPPVPDGGVEIVSCAALCDEVAGWTPDQVGCLTDMFSMFGTPPAECMADLTDVAACGSCVGAAGAVDDACATAGALCQ